MDFVSQLPASPNQNAVRGLNLLFLLVENRLAEFHSELELMGDEERASECVMFPVRLEQFLMVGSYDQARDGTGVEGPLVGLSAGCRGAKSCQKLKARRLSNRFLPVCSFDPGQSTLREKQAQAR